MKTRILSIIIALVVVSCSGDKQTQLNKLMKQRDQLNEQIKALQDKMNTDPDSTTKQGTRVSVIELKPTVFNHFIEVQGRVDADQNVNVYAEGTGGMVTRIFAKEGQQVVAGQVLAKLDDQIYQENLKGLQSSLDYVTSMYNKQKALWDQKIGSEAQYLDIKSKKDALESQVGALKEQIDMTNIKSPVSGTVEDVPVKVGQMVIPGIIVFRVVNLSSLKIVADLAEAYGSKVNNGDRVTVYLPDLKKEIEGKIDYSSKYINPTNRTFQVGVRLTSLDKNLKANMIAVLKINDYKAPDALVVPINTVQSDQAGTYVVIAEKTAKGSVAKRVPVMAGETYKGLTEIKSGLKPGNLIITAGYLELDNGQYVNY
jgi:membrane fusion protein, multidrug efflux system